MFETLQAKSPGSAVEAHAQFFVGSYVPFEVKLRSEDDGEDVWLQLLVGIDAKQPLIFLLLLLFLSSLLLLLLLGSSRRPELVEPHNLAPKGAQDRLELFPAGFDVANGSVKLLTEFGD